MKERPVNGVPRAARRMRRQAREIRRMASQSLGPVEPSLAPWQQILAVPLVAALLAGSLALLLFGEYREQLLARASAAWMLTRREPAELYRLPPPPPRPARADLHFPAQPGPLSQPEVVPVGQATSVTAAAPQSDPPEFTPPQKDARWEEAFGLLSQESSVVDLLLKGEVEGLRFEDWSPLRAEPPRYSIRLDVFRESEQRVIPLAWSVDVSSGQTRPENQEARDLFFRLRRR